MKNLIIIVSIMFFASVLSVKADGINAIVKKQRMEESVSKATKDRVHEVFNVVVSTIKELQRKGVKFANPPIDDSDFAKCDTVIASSLNRKVVLCKDAIWKTWNIYFYPKGAWYVPNIYIDGNKIDNVIEIGSIDCPIFDGKCVVSNKQEIKSSVLEVVEKSTNENP